MGQAINSAISVLHECETVMKNVLLTPDCPAALTERFSSPGATHRYSQPLKSRDRRVRENTHSFSWR